MSTIPTYPSSGLAGNYNSTISTNHISGQINIKSSLTEVEARLDAIEKRLLILQPSFELHDKYPSLKEAYEAYKIIETLINEGK